MALALEVEKHDIKAEKYDTKSVSFRNLWSSTKNRRSNQKKTSNRYSTYIYILCVYHISILHTLRTYTLYIIHVFMSTHTIIHNNSSYPSTYNYLFVQPSWYDENPQNRRENSCLVGLVISQRRVQVSRVPKGSGAWRSGDPGDPSKIQDFWKMIKTSLKSWETDCSKIGDGSELLLNI